jgi:outer membrane protein assembly factor BamE (lipoprotein component of BamABCDE complex)
MKEVTMKKGILIIAALALFAFMTMGASSCQTTAEHDTQMSDSGSQLAQGWKSIQVGDSMSTVEGLVGVPDDKQSFDDTMGHTECWYYGFSHQVCFDYDQRVESKNDY